MNNPDSKEKILNRIREGLKTANLRTFDKPTLTNREIFVPADKPLVNIFEEELTNISGLFFYCHTEDELIEKLKEIHQEKKLNLCYSPEKKFGEISKKAGIEFVEMPVAFDALTVVINPKNNWSKTITVAELKKIWEPAWNARR